VTPKHASGTEKKGGKYTALSVSGHIPHAEFVLLSDGSLSQVVLVCEFRPGKTGIFFPVTLSCSENSCLNAPGFLYKILLNQWYKFWLGLCSGIGCHHKNNDQWRMTI
jgi:hypothetical protein